MNNNNTYRVIKVYGSKRNVRSMDLERQIFLPQMEDAYMLCSGGCGGGCGWFFVSWFAELRSSFFSTDRIVRRWSGRDSEN